MNFHLNCVLPLATLKSDILEIRHERNLRKLSSLDFWSLLYGHEPSHPCLWLLTLVSLFPHLLHCSRSTDVLGFLLFGWSVLVVWWVFLKNLCTYVDIHIKPCSPCSVHILTGLTRCTQPLHLAFPHASQTPRTLELILLILCHTQDIWTLAGN